MEKFRWLRRTSPLNLCTLGQHIKKCKQILQDLTHSPALKQNIKLRDQILEIEYQHIQAQSALKRTCNQKKYLKTEKISERQFYKQLFSFEQETKQMINLINVKRKQLQSNQVTKRENIKRLQILKKQQYMLSWQLKQLKIKINESQVINIQKQKIISIQTKHLNQSIIIKTQQNINCKKQQQKLIEKQRQILQNKLEIAKKLEKELQKQSQLCEKLQYISKKVQGRQNSLKFQKKQIKKLENQLDSSKDTIRALQNKKLILKERVSTLEEICGKLKLIKQNILCIKNQYIEQIETIQQQKENWKTWAYIEIMHAKKILY